MKTLSVLLLLATAVWASAQQPEIIGFTADGMLTWTNSQSGLHCGVEYTADMSWSWIPWVGGPWNVVVTAPVCQAQIDMNHYATLDLSHIPPALRSITSQGFYRISASTNELEMPIVTHSVRVLNHCGNTVSNLSLWAGDEFGQHDFTNIPSLPPGASTSYIDVSARLLTNEIVLSPPSAGWRVAFTRPEDRRYVGTYMFGFGPPEKRITVTITNGNSMPVCCEWLNWTTNWYAYWLPTTP